MVYIFQLFDFRGSSWKKCNCQPTDYGSFGFNRRHRTSGDIIFRTYHCSFGEAEMGHSHFWPKKTYPRWPRCQENHENPGSGKTERDFPKVNLWKNYGKYLPQKPKIFFFLNRFRGSVDFQPFLPGVDPVFEGWYGGCPAPPRRCSWYLEKNHQKSIGFCQTFWRAGAATSGLGEFDFGNWLCRIHHYYVYIYIYCMYILYIYICVCVYLYFFCEFGGWKLISVARSEILNRLGSLCKWSSILPSKPWNGLNWRADFGKDCDLTLW